MFLKLVNSGSYFADKIVMKKEGKYVVLRKQGDNKKEFRFDLASKDFERIRHFKTTEDKIESIHPSKVTSWFTNCDLVTDDPKFAKMFIYAAGLDLQMRSPVRFVYFFDHYKVEALEKWLSHGIDFKKLNQCLQHLQNGGDILQTRRSAQGIRVYYDPSEFDKLQIKYLRELSIKQGGIDDDIISRIKYNWNPERYHMGKKLSKVLENQRYLDAFKVTDFSYRNDKETYNWLDKNRYGRSNRDTLLEILSKWSINLEAFCKYLLRLQYEAVSVETLMRNYDDYLEREFEMRGERRAKMNKYPSNWMSYYHKHHFNYKMMMNLKRQLEVEGKMEAYNAFKESNKHLEYKDSQYLIRLPENIEDIATEATQLDHCLYEQYTDRILDGETIILFMRDVNHPDESVLTVEVKYNGIEQARGYKNDDPTYEQKQWLLNWCEKKGLDRVIRQHY